MTREEAKTVFLNRGYVEVEGGTIYDADKWREACVVISEWLEQEPCEDTISRQNDILPNIDKKVESYKKLLKHPVVKHIIGLNEEQEQLDFVQPHKKIPVTLTVSGDLISREAVEEIINDIRSCISVEGYWAILERMKKLPPVNPQEPKPMLYIGDGYADGYMVYDMAECPTCGYEYEYGDKDWGLPFCPSCGQKLNWEKSEDKE